jgi:hypothetical protein
MKKRMRKTKKSPPTRSTTMMTRMRTKTSSSSFEVNPQGFH